MAAARGLLREAFADAQGFSRHRMVDEIARRRRQGGAGTPRFFFSARPPLAADRVDGPRQSRPLRRDAGRRAGAAIHAATGELALAAGTGAFGFTARLVARRLPPATA